MVQLKQAGTAPGLASAIQAPDFLKTQSANLSTGGLAGSGFTPGGGSGLNIGSQDALQLGLPGGNGLDWGNIMENYSLGAEGLTGLAGAYNSYKQMGMMEDQLKMQGDIANRNIANQAAVTNRQLDDRATMGAQMLDGAAYGTPEHLAAKKRLQTTVDGSPVA